MTITPINSTILERPRKKWIPALPVILCLGAGIMDSAAQAQETVSQVSAEDRAKTTQNPGFFERLGERINAFLVDSQQRQAPTSTNPSRYGIGYESRIGGIDGFAGDLGSGGGSGGAGSGGDGSGGDGSGGDGSGGGGSGGGGSGGGGSGGGGSGGGGSGGGGR